MRLDNLGAIIENSLREEHLRDIFKRIGPVPTLLDLGCGSRPYRHLYRPLAQRTIGADLPDSPFPKEDIDIFCSAVEISRHLPAASIDVVLCTEVLHDIAEPAEFFREVGTVLKPGGHLLLTTPFMVPICDGAYDHYRFTPVGLRYLCERHGFTVESLQPGAGLFGTMLQFAVRPQLKLWSLLSRALRVPAIYTRWNPLILFLVVLPQALYLAGRRLTRGLPALRALAEPFSYGATGYVTWARRDDGAPGR